MKVTILGVALLAGCATASNPVGWQSTHPDWHPPQGLDFAIAQCKVKQQETSGYDWVDAALKKGEIMKTCMHAYGYE